MLYISLIFFSKFRRLYFIQKPKQIITERFFLFYTTAHPVIA